MPPESTPKTTSDSQNLVQNLLAKCGINIPALSVRSRRASDQDASRPAMFTADVRDKKRKRSTRSLRTSSRTATKMTEAKEPPPEADFTTKDPEALLQHFLANGGYIEAYAKQRAELLNAEAVDAWDYDASTKASPSEKRAAIIIRELREFERKVVFGNNASEAIPGPETLDMGGQFLTNKARIEKNSELFKISKQVPKGAILHLHFNAELNPERLLKEAQEMDNMYVWSIQPLVNQEDLAETEMMFKVMAATTRSNNIFSPEYEGKAGNWRVKEFDQRVWMRWKEFQTIFEEKFGHSYVQSAQERDDNERSRTCSEPASVDLNPAEYWIMQKMVLSKEEAYEPTQTVNGVWARFNQATRCFKGLLNYQRVYEWYIDKAIDRMIDEKVMYAELRPMLLDKSIPADNGVDELSTAAQMRLIVESVDKKRKALEVKGQGDLFPFGLKIIYCTPRSIPIPKMRQEMKDCIELKIQFPDLICGFDLVGAEDRPNHIGFYYKELVAFQQTCRALDLEIPFLFHAGETLLDTGGSTDPANSNLYDAVALESKRIGHGFSLMKHPHLIEKFRRRKVVQDGKPVTKPGICIELCPISNELLHLCRNIKEHPYPELLAAKIPCCVNSDNPSLFSNSMSHEFYQVMVGSPTITVHSWKQLALWSLEYSCLEDPQKQQGKAIFEKTWDTFCEWVVREYDGLLIGDTINVEVANKKYGIQASA